MPIPDVASFEDLNLHLLKSCLVNDLLSAQHELKLSRFMAGICKHDLLILDKFGFIPFSRDGANLLFQLCSVLYERTAIIITSNLKFGDWTSVMRRNISRRRYWSSRIV